MKLLKFYLEYGGLVVFLEVVGKDVGVHERTPTLAQDVQALLQELDLSTQNTFVKAPLCIKKQLYESGRFLSLVNGSGSDYLILGVEK